MNRTYTTVQGDMWDSIAYRLLGSEYHTDKLMNANQQYRGITRSPPWLSAMVGLPWSAWGTFEIAKANGFIQDAATSRLLPVVHCRLWRYAGEIKKKRSSYTKSYCAFLFSANVRTTSKPS